MRAALRRGAWALTIGLVLALPVQAQTVALGRDQAVALARQAWLAGDVTLAYAISSKIAAADPGDVEALLLLSATTGAMGDAPLAFRLGKRAWVAARAAGRPDGLRYDIANQTARAALSAGQPRRALWWLGQAAAIAPSEAQRQQTAANRDHLKAQIPLGFSASLQMAPTDNLNNGATTGLLAVDDHVFGTISGWSVAHAGVVANVALGATYALAVSASGRARTELGFDLSGTFHALTAEEARDNPELEASDLDMTTATARWTQDRFVPGIPQGPVRFTVEASQNWFAGQLYAPALRAEVMVPLTARTAKTQLALQTVLEQQWQDDPSGVVNGASLHLAGQRALALPWGEGSLGFGLGGTALRSGFSNTTYDSLDASLTLDPALSLGPVTTRFGVALSWRHYDTYSLGLVNVTKGRTDHSASLSASFGLGDATVAGLTPTLTLQRQIKQSNISKYETDATSVYLGLASRF